MTTFVEDTVRVSVPATSANLGPGFDCLGVALDLRDRLEAEIVADGLVVQVDGGDEVPLDESHLVVQAMRAAFEAMNAAPSGLRLRCHNTIPHGRGLGSSAAAIVGGICLARGLVAGGRLLMDDEAVLDLAARMEGHPDNVAPAFLGGFVISGREGDGWYAVRSGLDPRISAVVFVPPQPVSTEKARALLPDEVRHREAAENSGRAALLVAALAAQPEQLHRATRDLLHQEHRRPAMPASLELVDRLRADGVPAVVSGAGPTVLAFANGPTAPGTTELLARCPDGWTARHLGLDTTGVHID